ncbi:PqqD family protein [Granulicella arctica]|uniref:PqqD family protein n=1 Tax=Granulicella arctica TaxID=940613 RepID=UPI0021E020DA|nr:PqqD family protein [Granulicella arctica]
MPHDTSITIPKHVLSESLNDETVLLDMSSGLYFGLSPVASRYWQLLGEGVSAETTRSTILAEFDVTPEVLDSDLDSLLSELESKKLIERQTN